MISVSTTQVLSPPLNEGQRAGPKEFLRFAFEKIPALWLAGPPLLATVGLPFV
jgi:hypothetical protein